MKIVTVVGARPQFIKIAAVSRKLRERHQEILVHTGQHYNYEMSEAFFDGLALPRPDVNLGVGSGSHAVQTGAMLKGIEEVLLTERADCLLIFGDTNSTLAGVLVASKLSIPVVHVEAGLRSFNRRMPEEINRIVTDHLSDLLLCPSETAVNNLLREGITANVHLVGDVMLDALNWAKDHSAGVEAALLQRLGLKKGNYLVLTVHRAENTDHRLVFQRILETLNLLNEPIVFPAHPRARKIINDINFCPKADFQVIDPLGYLEMIALVSAARLVLTDSGGLQKEAYWLGVPCVTLRNETEWVETVNAGWNVLVGPEPDEIARAVKSFAPPDSRPPLYGSGDAADKCVDLIGFKSEPMALVGRA